LIEEEAQRHQNMIEKLCIFSRFAQDTDDVDTFVDALSTSHSLLGKRNRNMYEKNIDAGISLLDA
jgi:hypothetical protein